MITTLTGDFKSKQDDRMRSAPYTLCKNSVSSSTFFDRDGVFFTSSVM